MDLAEFDKLVPFEGVQSRRIEENFGRSGHYIIKNVVGNVAGRRRQDQAAAGRVLAPTALRLFNQIHTCT